MRVRHHLFVGKAAELVADHFQFVIQTAGAERRLAVIVAHQRHKRSAGGSGIALGHKTHRRHPRRFSGDAQVLQSRDFPLRHRNPAVDLA